MKNYLIVIYLCAGSLVAKENHWVALDSGNWSDQRNWHSNNVSERGEEMFVLSDDSILPISIRVSSDSTLAILKFDFDWAGLGHVIESANGSHLISRTLQIRL